MRAADDPISQDMMKEEVRLLRTIVQFASRDALDSKTAQMLSRLGYRILMPDDLEELRLVAPETHPDLLLVDERRLAEVVDDEEVAGPTVPIILLSGRQGATGAHPRVIGGRLRGCIVHGTKLSRRGATRERGGNMQ